MSHRGDVPEGNEALQTWANNYSAKITATPTAYGLVAGDATALAALVSDYSTRLASALNPATKTKVTVAAKNTSKAALIARCRQLARIIKANPTVTNAQREELGLHVRDSVPTPVPPPVTHPVVSIDKLGSLQSSLRITDEMTPSSRAKPDGVQGAYLYVKIDGTAPATPDDCKFAGTATRNQHVISFPSGSAGKTFYVLAQWVNHKLEAGPVSSVVSSTIAA